MIAAIKIGWRMLTTVSPRLLWKFSFGAGLNNLIAITRFERRRKRNEPYFPAFTFISLTNRCDLRCRGCWVTATPPTDMPVETLAQIIEAGKKEGCRFFGLLGGEPLLYKPLFEILEKHADCYFQLLTNGQGLNDEVASKLRKLGNVSPLISIEGGPISYAERRGSSTAYGRAVQALEACRRHGLVFGVATSVCRSNMVDVVCDEFLDGLAREGVHYAWYYIFRPAGPNPSPEEALDGPAIDALRTFIVDQRLRRPFVIIDSYWDDMGRALCPAATGISVHINASGDVEPCPPVQFADVRAGTGTSDEFRAAVAHSPFLTQFRKQIPTVTRGCVLLDSPAALRDLVKDTGPRDTTGRDGMAELAARTPLAGHDRPGHEIPEKSWFYRFAKRHWFFGFGAYG